MSFLFTVQGSAFSQSAAQPADFPVYLTSVSNPNDFTLFATSGWDGNWYAGSNNCWIKKLPPVPTGDFQRVYVGARLGRMKIVGPVGRPPEFPAIAGEFWMGLSSTSAWRASESVRIAFADQVPLEGHGEYAIEGTGESQWFWAEVPLDRLNRKGDNYLVLWSNTPAYVSASSAPIVAAALGDKDVDSWLCKDVRGQPPAKPSDPPGTGVSFFQPALALKLIPRAPAHPMQVRLVSWRTDAKRQSRPVITASVSGESVETVWVEVESKTWQRTGRPLWKAPYIFTLDPRQWPTGKVRLRVVAQNIWGETATSDAFGVEVGKTNVKK